MAASYLVMDCAPSLPKIEADYKLEPQQKA
jgi:hypothetical protein